MIHKVYEKMAECLAVDEKMTVSQFANVLNSL